MFWASTEKQYWGTLSTLGYREVRLRQTVGGFWGITVGEKPQCYWHPYPSTAASPAKR